jgi:NADPH:quinone reductase-like Zn-dependent oxidoreductase
MVRAVRFYECGGPEVLKIETIEVGEPKQDEARVKIQSIGLNRAESAFRTGYYLEKAVFPSLLGYEGAGIIEAIGSTDSEFKVGDAVCITPTFSMTKYGTYAECAIVPISSLIKRPPSISELEGSALWMPYLTAYGMVKNIKAGDAVLITAASSSIGLALIQIINRLSGIPIAITRTNVKKDALLKAGAKHVIVTAEENIAERINQITANKGARLIVDPIAGPGVIELADALGEYGELILYGNLSGKAHETPFPYRSSMGKGISMSGFFVVKEIADKEKYATAREFILSGLKDGSLKPTIDRVFSFDEIVQAHIYLEESNQIGKIVVKTNA